MTYIPYKEPKTPPPPPRVGAYVRVWTQGIIPWADGRRGHVVGVEEVKSKKEPSEFHVQVRLQEVKHGRRVVGVEVDVWLYTWDITEEKAA